MANRTIRTPKKEAAFLEALSINGGNVARACARSRFSRNAAYQWRAADPGFARKWAAAVEMGTDALEDEAVRRAHEGTERPVYHQGEQVGTVRVYSDTLMILMLKARRPNRYKERTGKDHSGRVGSYVATAPSEAQSQLRAELATAGVA